MSHTLFDPKRILYKLGTTKRWWVPIFILAVVAVNLLGLLRPPKYTSSAQVFIYQPTISNANIQQTFNLSDTLDTLNERITSPAFLADVARKLNLDAGMDPRSAEYDQLLNKMRDSIEIRKSPDLFKVSFTWFTPQQTYDVTYEIVRQVIAQSADFYRAKAKKNVELLETQLMQETLLMQQAQERIKQYKDLNPDQTPEAKIVQLERLSRAQTELQNSKAEAARLRNFLQEAKLQLATIPKTVDEINRADTSGLQMLQQQRVNAKIQLDTMLQTFTEDHWEVQKARETIKNLDQQITSATALVTQEVTSQPNPKFIEQSTRVINFQMQLDTAESNVQAKQNEISQIETYLKSNPTHENELMTLEREYKAHVAQTEYLRARLSEAQQASYVDAKGGGPSFDLQSPPRVPTSPSSPDRFKILLASVFLAGCAAGAVVMLFVLLDQTVRSIDEARSLLRMPMLGTVQKIVTPRQVALESRRRLYRALGTAIVLVVLGAASYAAFTYYEEEVLFNLGRVRDFMKQM